MRVKNLASRSRPLWGAGCPRSINLLDVAPLALLLVILVGAALRFNGLTFGLPAVNESDELMFELGAMKMLAGKTLNPGWFGHPATTTMYLLAVLDVVVFAAGWLVGAWADVPAFVAAMYHDPGIFMLPHRVAMVLVGLGTILLTARIARRIWHADGDAGAHAGSLAALGAAALLAVNPVHAAWSQIIRSDGLACMFLLLCINACLDVAQHGRRRDWLRAAAWLALAIATKWPFALGALAIGGGAVLQLRAGAPIRTTFIRFALTMGMTLLLLVAVSPYLLLDYRTVLANLAGEAQPHHVGATGGTPLENLLWYLRGPLWSGLGAGGAILALAGLWAARRNGPVLCIVLPVAAGFVAAFMLQNIVWERWTLPIMPLLAVLAGGGLVMLGRVLDGLLVRERAAVVVTAVLLLACAPLWWNSWGRGQERLNDTRQQSVRWAHAHIPDGDSVLIEHFAFDMLDRDWPALFPLGDRGCVDAQALLAGRIKYDTVDKGRGTRSNIDYGTLNPAMRPTCGADWAILSQADRYASEAARFPAEHAAYRALISSGEIVASFYPEPRRASGPIIRIIRFRR
ncbi:MAG: glycosyltransferase family 39 protein [Pseudomonadota bacterium]